MNNTYTYVVPSCAKTCCSRETFSTRFEHCIFTSCLSFHMARKENFTSVVENAYDFFLQICTKCCFDIIRQGEIDIFEFDELSKIFEAVSCLSRIIY